MRIHWVPQHGLNIPSVRMALWNHKAEYGVDEALLAVLELEYLLFECGGADETVDEDGTALALTVGTADSLFLGSGVPPWVEEEDIIGLGEVEAYAASLQGDKEELACGVLLEPPYDAFPVGGCAGEHGIRPAAVVHLFCHNVEKLHKFTENQYLVRRAAKVVKAFENLGELPGGCFLADHLRCTGYLPQPCYGRQGIDIVGTTTCLKEEVAHPALFDGIERGLLRRHIAVDYLVLTLRQTVEDLCLRAAEKERCHHLTEYLRVSALEVLVDGVDEILLKLLFVAEQLWVQDIHQGPELMEVVLHGCSAEGYAAWTCKPSHRLIGQRGVVLEELRLVEEDHSPTDSAETVDVVAHGGIGGYQHIVVVDV